MSYKIPKIIHQIWFDFGYGRDIGDHNKRLIKRMKEKNSNYISFLWREEDADNLLKKYYPNYWCTYHTLEPVIKKVDFLRFFILHHYGGIYLDMDFYCLKNFDDYFNDFPQYKDSDIILSRSCYGPWITNSIMMSAKGSKFWEFCMKKVKDKELIPWWGELQTHIDTSCTAGPYFMTKVVECYQESAYIKNKITIVDVPYFISIDFKDAVYAWHEGHTSWIEGKHFVNPEIVTFTIILILFAFIYKRY